MKPLCVLIDGKSGAGKTTFANKVVELLRTERCGGAQLVHLDDVYPGWEGLAEASEILERHILAAKNPGFYPWDWQRNQPQPQRIIVQDKADLVVEGCGSITTGTIAAAQQKYQVLSIDIDLPEAVRKLRALQRSPEMVPYWGMWAAQEQTHRASMPQADIQVTEKLDIDLDIIPVHHWIRCPK